MLNIEDNLGGNWQRAEHCPQRRICNIQHRRTAEPTTFKTVAGDCDLISCFERDQVYQISNRGVLDAHTDNLRHYGQDDKREQGNSAQYF